MEWRKMARAACRYRHSIPAAAVIPGLPLPSSRTWFGISFARGMSHGFEIADAISFKEAGYCWGLGHPELAATVIPCLPLPSSRTWFGISFEWDAEFGCMQPRSAWHDFVWHAVPWEFFLDSPSFNKLISLGRWERGVTEGNDVSGGFFLNLYLTLDSL